MQTAEMIAKVIMTVALFWIVFNAGVSIETIARLVIGYLIVLGLWRAHGFSGAVLDLRLARNRIEHARAATEEARAKSEEDRSARVIPIPGVNHEVILIHHGIHEVVPISAAPVVATSGEVLPADELRVLISLAKLIELSIVQFGSEGRQVTPAAIADGKIGVKWQTVIDYAGTRGWVYTSNEGTFCKAPTSNLAALRIEIGHRAPLPHP